MFKPYQHGTESVQIDDLTIENQIDCISVYGNLQITKDQFGLKNAKALQTELGEICDCINNQVLILDILFPPEEAAAERMRKMQADGRI